MLASSRSRSREQDRLRPKVGWEKRPDGRIYCKRPELSSLLIANGLWPCAAVAGHARPARALGVGEHLAGRLRRAGDKRQEPHDTGGGDGDEGDAQRPLQQQSS
jgi:hypothetical protein